MRKLDGIDDLSWILEKSQGLQSCRLKSAALAPSIVATESPSLDVDNLTQYFIPDFGVDVM